MRIIIATLIVFGLLVSPVNAQSVFPGSKQVLCTDAPQQMLSDLNTEFKEVPVIAWETPSKTLGMVTYNKDTGGMSVVEVDPTKNIACMLSVGDVVSVKPEAFGSK